MIITLDFETSGTDHNRHAPVTLGVAIIDEAGVKVAQDEWLFAPPYHYKTGKVTREYDINAMLIHEVPWPRIVKHGTPCADVLRELGDMAESHHAGNALVLAYNAPFDFGWYSTCLFLAGGYDRQSQSFKPAPPPIVGPWQCVMLLAKREYPHLPDHKLDTVAKHLGLARTTDAHGALEDALLCYEIYKAIQEAQR